jgi:hypothetical protein
LPAAKICVNNNAKPQVSVSFERTLPKERLLTDLDAKHEGDRCEVLIGLHLVGIQAGMTEEPHRFA